MSRFSTDPASPRSPGDSTSNPSNTRPAGAGTWRGRLTEPSLIVLLVLGFQLILWGIVSGHLAIAPPDDSLEQVLLSQTLLPEYGKHPPMPTWLLWASNSLFGASIGATYVLGTLCSIATTLLLYAFARPLIGAPRAALAAVLMTNIEYLSAGTAYYNHNTVQLPLAVLACMMFHRALTRMRWRDWAWFGASCGAMMLAKYSAVVLFASFGVYLLWSGRWRDPVIWGRLALAAFVGAAVFAPYFLALRSDAWSPRNYAMHSVFPGDVDRVAALKTVWAFTTSQLAKVLPALLIFAAVRRGAARNPPAAPTTVALSPFLTIVSFGPMALTVAIAAASGAFLLTGWGTTFHVLLTFWLVAARPFAIDVKPGALRAAAIASVVVQSIVWALMSTHGGRIPNLNPTPHPVAPPTPAALGDAVRQAWAAHCTVPLREVVSGVHTGSALAVAFQGQPRVLDGTREEFAKFYSDDVRATEGAVVVVPSPAVPVAAAAGSANVPPRSIDQLLADASWRSTVELPASDGHTHAYTLAVVAPTAGPGCE